MLFLNTSKQSPPPIWVVGSCLLLHKDTLDLLFRPPWGICPAVYVGLSLLGQIIGQGRQDHTVLGICINEHQLDLHALGKDAFDEHRRPMPHQPSQLGGGPFVMAVRLDLGKPRQIGSQLHEDPVFLHTADDPRHRLPGMEIGGVFFPGAQQLSGGQEDPPGQAIYSGNHGLHHRLDHLSVVKPIPGMGYAGYRNGIYRQKRSETASDVHKGTEILHVGHLG